MTVWPGFSSPDFSAASITPSARRSFTEPRGLNASILTNRFTCAGASLFMRTAGVLPTVSRMLPYLAISLSAFACRRRWALDSLGRIFCGEPLHTPDQVPYALTFGLANQRCADSNSLCHESICPADGRGKACWLG